MTVLRVRIFGEARHGRALAEYQEALETELDDPAAGDVYDAAIAAVMGYRDTVREHADVVEPPSALVVIVEPVEAAG
jgi:hypothetical protein